MECSSVVADKLSTPENPVIHRAAGSKQHRGGMPQQGMKPFAMDFVTCMGAEVRGSLPSSTGVESV